VCAVGRRSESPPFLLITRDCRTHPPPEGARGTRGGRQDKRKGTRERRGEQQNDDKCEKKGVARLRPGERVFSTERPRQEPEERKPETEGPQKMRSLRAANAVQQQNHQQQASQGQGHSTAVHRLRAMVSFHSISSRLVSSPLVSPKRWSRGLELEPGRCQWQI